MMNVISIEYLRTLGDMCPEGIQKLTDAGYADDDDIPAVDAIRIGGLKDSLYIMRHIKLTPDQERGLRLFACDCAEHVLCIYETKYDSEAPRKAIEVSRAYVRGEATMQELEDARAARAAYAVGAARAAARAVAWAAYAVDAARAVAWAAYAAAWAADAAYAAAWAADAAYAAAYAAARADMAAYAAEQEWQLERLIEVFSYEHN